MAKNKYREQNTMLTLYIYIYDYLRMYPTNMQWFLKAGRYATKREKLSLRSVASSPEKPLLVGYLEWRFLYKKELE